MARKRSRASAVVLYALVASPSAAIWAWYNYVRFGSVWQTSPVEPNYFSLGHLGAGLYGFLLSPGKSIFLYIPALPIAIYGTYRMSQFKPLIAAFAGFIALYHLLIYALWTAWHGGWCWGPRFLLPAVPLLWLGFAFSVDEFGQWSKVWKALAWVLVAASIAVTLLGVCVFYMAHLDRMEAKYGVVGPAYYQA